MEINNLSDCDINAVTKHSLDNIYKIDDSSDILSVSDIESYSMIKDTKNTNEIIFNGKYSTRGLFFHNCNFETVSINFNRGISNIVFFNSYLYKLNFRETESIKDLYFIDSLFKTQSSNDKFATISNFCRIISKSHIHNIVFVNSKIKKIVKHEKYHHKKNIIIN